MSTENQIVQFLAEAIRRNLKMDAQSCFATAAPDYDPSWKGDFVIEVMPGPVAPYGGGVGSQDGGALLREQTITLFCFVRMQLDQYSRSTVILTEQEKGILDRFESIRTLIGITMLSTVASPAGPNDFLLIEPIRWTGRTRVEWESTDPKIIRASMNLQVCYGVDLPDASSLSAADYT
jgi:hypothetical protein